jgi:hypothetical protein
MTTKIDIKNFEFILAKDRVDDNLKSKDKKYSLTAKTSSQIKMSAQWHILFRLQLL